MCNRIDTPLPLQVRLTKTLLSRKPASWAPLMAIGTILVMGLTSQCYWQNIYGLASALPASSSTVFGEGQWWRLFTATFIHGDFGHYASNMYMLSIFSFLIYGYYGMWLYPIYSLLMAALVNGISIWTYPPQTNLLGASGLVYILAGIWLTLYALIQKQHSLLSRLLRVTGTALVVLFPSTFEPATSYRTHIFGFIAGVLIAGIHYLTHRKALRAFDEYTLVE